MANSLSIYRKRVRHILLHLALAARTDCTALTPTSRHAASRLLRKQISDDDGTQNRIGRIDGEGRSNKGVGRCSGGVVLPSICRRRWFGHLTAPQNTHSLNHPYPCSTPTWPPRDLHGLECWSGIGRGIDFGRGDPVIMLCQMNAMPLFVRA